jgi:hypothetical protein
VPLPVVPGESAPSRGDPRGKIAVIRAAAEKYGVDPDVAVKVAKSEGLAQFYGDNGASGGAFQLYTKGGLGNEFQKETGLNPLDQKNEDATIDYAMRRASQDGWGPWYGAAKVGVGKYDGIKGKAVASSDAPLDPTPNVGSGAKDYETNTASTTTPKDDEKTKDDKKKKSYGEAAGEAIEGIGKLYSEGPVAKNAARASGPMNVPTTMTGGGMGMGPQPMVDARLAEAQRQQLAFAMQRLNTGRLY